MSDLQAEAPASVVPEDLMTWEPWHPRLGQRVRVLSRPECHYCREDHDAEVGAVGIISRIEGPGAAYCDGEWDRDIAAHPYWVTFDVPLTGTVAAAGGLQGMNSFAAIELEPVA